MTDAGWTSEKPTEEGYYWFKAGPMIPWIARVTLGDVDRGLHYLCARGYCPVDECPSDVRWIGPLSPDTYHQGRVAGELFGLQQGLLIAYIFESGTAKQVIEGLKSRIAELEQQAQGGEAK